MILPCVYSALPNKTTETYIEMLAAIKNIVKPIHSLNSPLKPTTALTDFELAMQHALVNQFPSLILKGCFFHFKL